MRIFFTLLLSVFLGMLAGCATMKDWGQQVKETLSWESTEDSSTSASSETSGDAVARTPEKVSGEIQLSQSDIRRAQQRLKGAGYNPGPADGIIGPKTRSALRKYQDSKGLEKSGTLDEQTVTALGLQLQVGVK